MWRWKPAPVMQHKGVAEGDQPGAHSRLDRARGKMETLSAVTNYISEFRYEPGVTPMTAYWVPLVIGASYLAGVYLLQMFMKNRERIPAKTFSLFHNFNMYAISIVCFLGISYGVAQTLYVRRDTNVRRRRWIHRPCAPSGSLPRACLYSTCL